MSKGVLTGSDPAAAFEVAAHLVLVQCLPFLCSVRHCQLPELQFSQTEYLARRHVVTKETIQLCWFSTSLMIGGRHRASV
jgi:hypothetical protein